MKEDCAIQQPAGSTLPIYKCIRIKEMKLSTWRWPVPNTQCLWLLYSCSQYLAGWAYAFVLFLCPGALKGSPGSGSGFKASQKKGPLLSISPDKHNVCGRYLAITSTVLVGLWALWFYVCKHSKARTSLSTITRHQEDKLSTATSSLFPIKMIAILERT